jgi:hypothetical protein
MVCVMAEGPGAGAGSGQGAGGEYGGTYEGTGATGDAGSFDGEYVLRMTAASTSCTAIACVAKEGDGGCMTGAAGGGCCDTKGAGAAGTNACGPGATENCEVDNARLSCLATGGALPTECGNEGVGEVTWSTGCNRCEAMVAGETAVVTRPSSRMGAVVRGAMVLVADVMRPTGSSPNCSSESGCMLRVAASSSAATGEVPEDAIVGAGLVACRSGHGTALVDAATMGAAATLVAPSVICATRPGRGNDSCEPVCARWPAVVAASRPRPCDGWAGKNGRSDGRASARCQLTRSLLMRSSPTTCPCIARRCSSAMPVASWVMPVVGRNAYQTTSSCGTAGAARKTA